MGGSREQWRDLGFDRGQVYGTQKAKEGPLWVYIDGERESVRG